MVPVLILPGDTGSSTYDDDYYITSYGYEPAEYAYGATDNRKSGSKISYARNSFGSKSGKSYARNSFGRKSGKAKSNGGQAAGSYYSYYRQRSIIAYSSHLLQKSQIQDHIPGHDQEYEVA